MADSILFALLAFVAYAYAGYPCLLFFLGKRPGRQAPAGTPHITVLVAAHNEEVCIDATVRAVLASDYPPARLDVIVASDASTDATDARVSAIGSDRIDLLRLPGRGGKAEALRTAARRARGEIIVLIDASSMLLPDAIERLSRHFADPAVGSVVGSRFISPSRNAVGRGDSLYWRYESLIRSLESRTGASWVGIEGGLSAIRRELLSFDFSDGLAADYALGCQVYRSGFVNRYDASARFEEAASSTLGGEFSRKVRVIVRGIRAFFANADLLNPFHHPGFAFQNLSHRLCRWLVPFALLGLLAVSSTGGGVRRLFLVGQLVFYGAAILGLLLPMGRSPWWLAAPQYFVTMNLAALVAWGRARRGIDVWQPTSREGPY